MVELATPADSKRPGPPPSGHYELREHVARGRTVPGFWGIWWCPDETEGSGERGHRELVVPEKMLPLLAEALARHLVEHQLPFGAAAQGSLRRAGIPFPARPGGGDWPEDTA